MKRQLHHISTPLTQKKIDRKRGILVAVRFVRGKINRDDLRKKEKRRTVSSILSVHMVSTTGKINQADPGGKGELPQ